MRTENTFLYNLIYVKLKWTICIFEESMSYLTTYKIVQIPEMFNCSIVLQLASYLFHEALHDHFCPDLILWLVTPCYHDCCPPLHASTICYLVYFCVYIPTFFFQLQLMGWEQVFHLLTLCVFHSASPAIPILDVYNRFNSSCHRSMNMAACEGSQSEWGSDVHMYLVPVKAGSVESSWEKGN